MSIAEEYEARMAELAGGDSIDAEIDGLRSMVYELMGATEVAERLGAPADHLDYFTVVGVRFHGTQPVRDPIDPRLHLELLSASAPKAVLRLTFGDALTLVERISQEMNRRIGRQDIHAAIYRTQPIGETP